MDEELQRRDLERHAAAVDVRRICEAAARGREDLIPEARMLLTLLERPGVAVAALRARLGGAERRLKAGPNA